MSKFNIAYFINQYPKVSHSFIRREILALERQGFSVERIALRGWDGELVDVEDLRERGQTQYILQDGVGSLLLGMLRIIFARPIRFARALAASAWASALSARCRITLSTSPKPAACCPCSKRPIRSMCTHISVPIPPRW